MRLQALAARAHLAARRRAARRASALPRVRHARQRHGRGIRDEAVAGARRAPAQRAVGDRRPSSPAVPKCPPRSRSADHRRHRRARVASAAGRVTPAAHEHPVRALDARAEAEREEHASRCRPEPPSAKPIASAPILIAQLATEMRGAAVDDREHQAVARACAEAWRRCRARSRGRSRRCPTTSSARPATSAVEMRREVEAVEDVERRADDERVHERADPRALAERRREHEHGEATWRPSTVPKRMPCDLGDRRWKTSHGPSPTRRAPSAARPSRTGAARR